MKNKIRYGCDNCVYLGTGSKNCYRCVRNKHLRDNYRAKIPSDYLSDKIRAALNKIGENSHPDEKIPQ